MSDLSWDATSNSSPKFSQGPRYVQYSDPCARLSTFKTWPTSIQLKPEKLAEAGFFYTGNYVFFLVYYTDEYHSCLYIYRLSFLTFIRN